MPIHSIRSCFALAALAALAAPGCAMSADDAPDPTETAAATTPFSWPYAKIFFAGQAPGPANTLAGTAFAEEGCNTASYGSTPDLGNFMIGRVLNGDPITRGTSGQGCAFVATENAILADPNATPAAKAAANIALSQSLTWVEWQTTSVAYRYKILDTAVPGGIPIEDGSHAIYSAYDSTVTPYAGELWVAFECAITGTTTTSCVGPLTWDDATKHARIDTARISAVVNGGACDQTSPTCRAASVPKLVVFGGTLYLYWDDLTYNNPAVAKPVIANDYGLVPNADVQQYFASVAVRGAALAQDPLSRRMYVRGAGAQVIASSSPLSSEVLANADVSQIIAYANSLVAVGSLAIPGDANTTCALPLNNVPDCYRLLFARATDPLAYHGFSLLTSTTGNTTSSAPATPLEGRDGLPNDPAVYQRFIYRPATGTTDLMGGQLFKISAGITPAHRSVQYTTIEQTFPWLDPTGAPSHMLAPICDPIAQPYPDFIAFGGACVPHVHGTDVAGGFRLDAGTCKVISGMRLCMQVQGNLVLYDPNGTAVWATNQYTYLDAPGYDGTTFDLVNCPKCFAAFQTDGNLVLYDPDFTGNPTHAYWSSETANAAKTGARLEISSSNPYVSILAADGTPELFDLAGGWTLAAGQTLAVGNLHLSMQTDGNLVLYTAAGAPIWAANNLPSLDHGGTTPPGGYANGSCGGCSAVFQATDGNLVLYTAAGAPYWASNTPGNAGAVLQITAASPYLAILNPYGAEVSSLAGGDNPAFAPTVEPAVSYDASPAYTVVPGIQYGLTQAEVLDLLIPTSGPAAHPLVVLIHGGGWQAGLRAPYQQLAEEYARRGYAVANVDYRLTEQGAQSPPMWPAQLEDVQAAVRYLRASAGAYHLNPNLVCAQGDSAGGHLALFLGSLAAVEPGDRAALYPGISPQVQCVIDNFGPADLTAPEIGTTYLAGIERVFGPKPEPALVVNGQRYATPATSQGLWSSAAITTRITAHSAPTFIAHGTQDLVVPQSQATELAGALAAIGAPYQIEYFTGGHEFVAIDPSKPITPPPAPAVAVSPGQVQSDELAFLARYFGF